MNWANCQCLVLGPGVSGVAAAKLLKFLGAKVYLLGKGEPASWKDYPSLANSLGSEFLLNQEDGRVKQILGSTRFLILSPGIAREIPLIANSGLSPESIINEIELAYLVMPMKILAITGTNGKTTTVTLLGNIIRDSYPDIFVGGNIGIPLCEAVLAALQSKTKISKAVLELSSFQLESLFATKVEAAAVLNITPSHGERYQNFAPYRDAKLKLGTLLVPGQSKHTNFIIPKLFTEEFKRLNTSSATPINILEVEESESFLKKWEESLNLSLKLKLPGHHNRFNALVAAQLALFWNIEKRVIEKVVADFCGVSHRIESVANNWGIKIYNDSKSTNWQSTLTALAAMDDEQGKLALILGGMPRGGHEDVPYAEALVLLKKRNLQIATFGKVSASLGEFLKNNGLRVAVFSNLEQAVESFRSNKEVKCLLFSPAFPSFDSYTSYADRGNHFKQLINQ